MRDETEAPRCRYGLRAPLTVLIVFCVAGCGGKANVKGRVTYQGKPVIHGSIILIGGGNKQLSSARIDSEGNYRISDIAPGPAHIAVVSPDPTPPRPLPSPPPDTPAFKVKAQLDELRARKALPKVDPSKWFPLPRQYESTETSGITTILQRGDNTFDIELK
jgi:hypothetical protein